MEGLLPLIFLFGHVQSQSIGSSMGLGFNMGLGHPVVNPYLPGLGGGFNIFSGMNRNEEPTSPYVKQVFSSLLTVCNWFVQLHSFKVSSNCRLVEVKEFEGKIIDDYKKCVDIKMMAYNWIIEEMEPQGGACRWMMFSWKLKFMSWELPGDSLFTYALPRWRGGVRPGEETEGRRGACLCPATTENLCTKDRPACYFHT